MNPVLASCRVLLADDHAVVRMGFRLLLEGAGAEVVGEADSGEAALCLHAELAPDVLVMDVSMPGLGGIASLERLLATQPAARVLMLSAHHEAALPSRALRIGARGYLCKSCDPRELVRAVDEVRRDRRYLDPELARAVAFAQLNGGGSPLDTLTDKEFEVFLKLAQGRSVNDVASDFFLSPSTVGTHLYHIKQKLNLQNAAEMALLAVRSGLIEA
jgi:two-component system, NarL family, invasion response regulator UvrY